MCFCRYKAGKTLIIFVLNFGLLTPKMKKLTISLQSIVKLEITDHSIGSGGQVVSRVRVPSPGFDSRNFQTCLQEPSVPKKCFVSVHSGKEWRNNSYNY